VTSVREALRGAARRIEPGDARLLLAAALAIPRLELTLAPERPVCAAEAERFDGFLARRTAGEPVSRILGRREFWSLEFEIDAAVLDPRPDTETVVEASLSALPDRAAPLDVLDLGSGSGCILLALLSELPNAAGLAVDSSPAALSTARRNARRLGLAGRCRFLAADWGAALSGGFDLVASNPPYVPTGQIAALAREVARHDPNAALDGGTDGLDAFRAIASGLPRLLRAGGVAAIEVGDGQAGAVGKLLAAAGLEPVETRRDLAGRERCIVVRRGEKTIGMLAGAR